MDATVKDNLRKPCGKIVKCSLSPFAKMFSTILNKYLSFKETSHIFAKSTVEEKRSIWEQVKTRQK